MKNLFTYINSLIAAIITTLFILTVSFLTMLFSSGEEGYRTSYFGSLYFDSSVTAEETLEMEFGVASGIPILITVVILFILFLIILSFFKKRSATS
jgi:hypothetical protein